MSTGAIVMMIVAILIVWGGLAVGILVLRRHPDVREDGDERPPPDVP